MGKFIEMFYENFILKYYLVLFQRFLKKQDSRKVSEIEAKAIFK